MTRKLMIAACALAAVAFTGCQDQRQSAQDRLQKEQEKLSKTEQSAQEDVQKKEADAQQEIAEARTEAQEDVQSQEQDVAEQQRELAQTQQEENVAQADDTAMGGSGAAGAGTALAGSVTAASDNQLTLRPKSGQEVQVQVDQNTRVLGRDGKTLALTDIKEGDEVRASYEMRNGTNYATEVTVAHEKGLFHKAGDKSKEAVDGAKKGAQDLKHNTTSP